MGLMTLAADRKPYTLYLQRPIIKIERYCMTYEFKDFSSKHEEEIERKLRAEAEERYRIAQEEALEKARRSARASNLEQDLGEEIRARAKRFKSQKFMAQQKEKLHLKLRDLATQFERPIPETEEDYEREEDFLDQLKERREEIERLLKSRVAPEEFQGNNKIQTYIYYRYLFKDQIKRQQGRELNAEEIAEREQAIKDTRGKFGPATPLDLECREALKLRGTRKPMPPIWVWKIHPDDRTRLLAEAENALPEQRYDFIDGMRHIYYRGE
jgi:hypothetical protein